MPKNPFKNIFGKSKSKDQAKVKSKTKDKKKTKRDRTESRRRKDQTSDDGPVVLKFSNRSSDASQGGNLDASIIGIDAPNPLLDKRKDKLRPIPVQQEITRDDFTNKFGESYTLKPLLESLNVTDMDGLLTTLGEVGTSGYTRNKTKKRNALNSINRLTKKYGIQNYDLIMMHILKETDKLDGNWKNILTQIDRIYDNMPDSIKSPSNLKKITDQLFVAGTGVKDGIIVARSANFDGANFKTKAENIITYLNKLEKNVLDDITKDIGPFSDKGFALEHIALTTSDPHNGGEVVAIIETDKGKFMYKPRELSADAGLNGSQDSIYTELNKLLDAEFHLNTMKYWPQKGYGYQEFAEHADELNVSDAKKYYRQMGVLTVLAKMFGISDLHNDNVRVSPGGLANITDAELILDPNVLRGKEYIHTALSKALKETFIGDDLTPNTFFLATEKIIDEKDTVKARLKKGTDYRTAYDNGVDTVLKIVKDKEIVEPFKDAVIGIMSKMDDIRIVPISTNIFEESLVNYNKSKDKDEVLDDIVDKVFKGLEDQDFETHGSTKKFLKTAIEIEFSRGDIPRLSLDPRSGFISLDGKNLAKLPTDIKGMVSPTIESMADHKTADISAELID